MVKKWLSQKLECNEQDIEYLYNSKSALEFLMVWSLFETQCFGRFLKKNNIVTYAEKYYDNNLLEFLEQEFNHFYNRYQNEGRYRHLKHGDKFDFIDNLLKKPVDEFNNKERLSFLIYVVYRYRNNMFHGNKSLDSWLSYKKQINLCINIMIKIIDNHVEKNLEIA